MKSVRSSSNEPFQAQLKRLLWTSLSTVQCHLPGADDKALGCRAQETEWVTGDEGEGRDVRGGENLRLIRPNHALGIDPEVEGAVGRVDTDTASRAYHLQ